MKVTFLGYINGSYEYIGVARQGRGKGRIYFFRDSHVSGFERLQDDVDTLVVGSKIELDEYFLEIPEKEFSKIFEMLAPKSAKEMRDEIDPRAKSDLRFYFLDVKKPRCL